MLCPIKEFRIPKNLSSLGNGVFNICKKLSFFEVDEDSDLFSVKDGVLFDKEKKTLIRYPIGKLGNGYVVPEGVKEIKENAFSLCANLKSIVLPDSLERIGNAAFEGCSHLDNINVPRAVKTIPPYAFSKCTHLRGIQICNAVEEICDAAFSCCYSLVYLQIPESVCCIDSRAFVHCSNLNRIQIDKPKDDIKGFPWGAPKKSVLCQWKRDDLK